MSDSALSNKCPCCHSCALVVGFSGQIPHSFSTCERCGHIWRVIESRPDHYEQLAGRNSADPSQLNIKLKERIRSLRPLLAGSQKILELGCAEGDLAAHLKRDLKLTYVGIEPSMDRRAARKVMDRVYKNLVDLFNQEPNSKFDVILSFHVLEHISDLDGELGMWRSLCSPDSQIVVEVPNRAGNPYIAIDRNLEHVHQFQSSSLTALLFRHGFTVLSISTGNFESWVYPDGLRAIARVDKVPLERERLYLARLKKLFPNGFSVFGLGGDFDNYLAQILPQLPAGMLKGLHDTDSSRFGQKFKGLENIPVGPLPDSQKLPVLIASSRFTLTIRSQLLNHGVSEELLFDFSDLFTLSKLSA